jgi:hypothetical protein
MIQDYKIMPYANERGFKILVTTEEGKQGNLTRNMNQFRIVFKGESHKDRIGYTHPDFNLCRKIFDERAEVLRISRR